MRVLAYNTGIVRIRMWICQRTAYFKFIPSKHTHTHTHTHTHIIIIPFEDRELTGLKVDIAHFLMFLL